MTFQHVCSPSPLPLEDPETDSECGVDHNVQIKPLVRPRTQIQSQLITFELRSIIISS